MALNRSSLTKQSDFDRVYKQGRTVAGPLFNLKFAPNGLGEQRIAFVISKKTEKLSTGRNLVRRRLRAAFREVSGDIKAGFDVVVLVKRSAVGKHYSELRSEMENAFRRAGFLKRNPANAE